MADDDQANRAVFDLQRLRALIELMQEHNVAEIDLREGVQRIRIARTQAAAPTAVSEPTRHSVASVSHSPAPSPTPTAPAATADGPNIVIIRSPMVGTFYSRPNPNSEPFVKIGDQLKPETTVCIIEAMKMFNEIPAETRGRIVAVLVEDEEPVDHGRPLFKVDTTG